MLPVVSFENTESCSAILIPLRISNVVSSVDELAKVVPAANHLDWHSDFGTPGTLQSADYSEYEFAIPLDLIVSVAK